MWQILCPALMMVVGASASAGPEIGYHKTVGIPTAKKIKEYEEKIFAAENDILNPRIIGGALAPPNVFPFFAGLLIDLVKTDNMSLCGASLLTDNRLVTAAHCWYEHDQAWQFTVILGSQYLYEGGMRVATRHVITHPQYNPLTLVNDIAMIYLPINVVFNEAISPIDLPRGSELQSSYSGAWVTAIGFGQTDDRGPAQSILSYVQVQVITVEECQRAYAYYQPSQICTSTVGHVGICKGDSGGPLVIYLNGRLVLIGVTSYSSFDWGCANGVPSGYTRVTAYDQFIKQHLL